jgi:ribonucleoside-triphosphate reductase
MRIGDPCPKCGRPLVAGCSEPGCTAHVESYSRVVGYLRPISCFNPGKQQEYTDRKEFILNRGDHVE